MTVSCSCDQMETPDLAMLLHSNTLLKMSTLVIKRSLGAASLLLCLSSVQGAVVQSNTTYVSGTSTLPVSSTDLINIGQSTLAGFTVSANSSPDETPDPLEKTPLDKLTPEAKEAHTLLHTALSQYTNARPAELLQPE